MKTHACSYCGNMVEDVEYSNMFELHKKGCPVGELMEVRVLDDSAEEENTLDDRMSVLEKGTIIKVDGIPYALMADTVVFG